MPSFSSLELFVSVAIILFGFLGAILYFGARNGWLRHGYFTVPSVLSIVIGLFVLFQGLGSGVMFAAVGTHIEEHPIVALCINGLAEVLVLLCGTVLISVTARQNLFAIFRLEGFHETPVGAYLLAVPIMLLAQIGGSAASVLFERVWKFFPSVYSALDHYETASDQSLQGLVTAHGPLDFLLIFIFVALVPAIAEETLFRGFAQTNIERSGTRHSRPYLALAIASIVFAMIHLSVFKFPGLLGLGLTLGWLSYRTNNLFTGALAHAVNNGFIVVALYLNPEQLSANVNANMVNTDELSGTEALTLLVPVLVALAAFLFLFNRTTAHMQSRGNAEREFDARMAIQHAGSGVESLDEHSQYDHE